MVVVSFVFLNLFIAIIITQYEDSQNSENLPVGEATIEDFKKLWVKFDKKGTGFISVLKIRKLIDLILKKEFEMIL